MTHLQEFKHSLTAMSALLRDQRACLDDDQFERVRALQCTSFCKKAKHLGTLDIAIVSVLTQQVRDGPWSPLQVSELVLAINEQMMSSEPSPQKGPKKREPQELYHMENYYDQEHASVICNKDLSWNARCTATIDMMAKMGLIGASERSKARIFAVMMVACGLDGLKSGLSVQDIRDEYVQFTEAIGRRFKNNRGPGSMGYILEWPSEPAQLSSSIVQLIYGTSPPVKLQLDRDVLKRCRDAIVLRGNATVLRSQSREIAHNAGNSAQNPQVQLMQMMMQQMQQMQQQQQPQHRASTDIPIQFLNGPHQQSRQLHHQQLHERPAPLQLQTESQNSGQPTAESSPTSASGGTLPALMDQSATPLKRDVPALMDDATPPKYSPKQQAEDFLAALSGNKGKDCGKRKKTAEPKATANGKQKAAPAAKSSTGKAVAKTTGKCKKPVAGWTEQRRLKEYPKGCSKCAWKVAGCTPSCFKARGQVKS